MNEINELAVLSLRLLGDMTLERDGVRIDLPPSKKTRALLAYMALTDRPHRRERLCDLFWDVPDDPRGALRWSLSKLRALVDGPDVVRIIADRETVAFDRSGARIDLIEVQQRIDSAVEGSSIDELRRLAAMFTGEFLEGLDLPDCSEFHSWCITERENARVLHLRLLSALVDRLKQRPLDALEFARRHVAIDPHNESAWAMLARLLAAADRRREAEEQCEIGRRVLREVGVNPTGPLLKVMRNLRKTAAAPPVPADRSDVEPGSAHWAGPDESWPDRTDDMNRVPGSSPNSPRAGPAVAVQPFDTAGAEGALEVLAGGIAEDIIIELSRFRQLTVLAHGASPRRRGGFVNPVETGRELGVDYVVDGSLRRFGNRHRISVRLVEIATGNQLWAERYDREPDEFFAIQDQVVRTIAGTLVGRVQAAAVGRIMRKPPASLAAYECVLRARALPLGSVEAETEARRLLEQAIEIDPTYARAHACLAHALSIEWFRDMTGSDDLLEQAFEQANKAVGIDPNDSLCQMMLGRIHLHRKSFDLARPYYQRALDLNPGNPEQHAYMGVLCTFLGDIDDALGWFDQAKHLDPFYEPTWIWHILGTAQFIAGRYEEAIAAFSRSTTMPAWVQAYLAACHAMLGRMDRARDLAAKVIGRMPEFSVQRFVAKEPYRDAVALERLHDGMVSAGLPMLSAAAETGDRTAPGRRTGAAARPVATPDRPAKAVGGRPSIVVLPFRAAGEVGQNEFLADGITDDLITSLSHTLGLFVIARDTAYVYRGSSLAAAAIARELEVKYAVHGSIRISGDQMRATAYLVEADTGTEIWAERFEESLEDVFAVQDHITTQVLRALQIELLEGEQARVWHRSTQSVEAWGLLTQGLADYKQQTQERVHRARELFHRAVLVDPGYAAAWAWLAYAHWHDARFHWVDRPEDALARATECGEKALALDPALSEVHAVMGAILVLRRDYDRAIGAARKAVEINPNGAEATALLAFVLNWAGEPVEALELAGRANRFCPLHSSWYVALIAHAQRLLGKFDEALESYGDVIGSLPHYIMPRIGLTMCLAEMDRLAEAREQAKQVANLFPTFPLKRHLEMSAYRMEDHNKRRRNALRAAGLLN